MLVVWPGSKTPERATRVTQGGGASGSPPGSSTPATRQPAREVISLPVLTTEEKRHRARHRTRREGKGRRKAKTRPASRIYSLVSFCVFLCASVVSSLLDNETQSQ